MRTVIFVCLTLIFFLSSALANQSNSALLSIKRSGAEQVSLGSSENFTGSVVIEPLFHATTQTRASGEKVTFMAGARTLWHSHPLGQTLVVTEGRGLVQQWGKPLQEIRPGDVVSIPAGVKHWHGAVADMSMTHYAIQEHSGGNVVEWYEQVSDVQYRAQVNF